MEQEKELGVKIKLDITSIYEGRQDAIWYGGSIGTIEYDGYIVEIESVGEIVADLYIGGEYIENISTDWNNGVFFEKFSEYFNNDKELLKSVIYGDVTDEYTEEFGEKPVLFVQNNNWLEFNMTSKDGHSLHAGFIDNIIEDNDVLGAFEDIKFYLDLIKEYR